MDKSVILKRFSEMSIAEQSAMTLRIAEAILEIESIPEELEALCMQHRYNVLDGFKSEFRRIYGVGVDFDE